MRTAKPKTPQKRTKRPTKTGEMRRTLRLKAELNAFTRRIKKLVRAGEDPTGYFARFIGHEPGDETSKR